MTGKLTWAEVQALTLPVNLYLKQGFSSQTIHSLHTRPDMKCFKCGREMEGGEPKQILSTLRFGLPLLLTMIFVFKE
jgi:hypothetical protein